MAKPSPRLQLRAGPSLAIRTAPFLEYLGIPIVLFLECLGIPREAFLESLLVQGHLYTFIIGKSEEP